MLLLESHNGIVDNAPNLVILFLSMSTPFLNQRPLVFFNKLTRVFFFSVNEGMFVLFRFFLFCFFYLFHKRNRRKLFFKQAKIYFPVKLTDLYIRNSCRLASSPAV